MEREPEYIQGTFLGEMLKDENFREQIRTSFAVIKRADVMPKELVEYHRELLQTWGLMPSESLEFYDKASEEVQL